MKVICDRAALVEALGVVQAVVPSRTPKPVLQCVKLTAADGTLTLAATDLEAAIRITTDKVQIDKDGQALIPADKLNQICRECTDPTLTINVDDDVALITSEDSKFKVFGYPVADFPPMPDEQKLGPADVTMDIGQMTALIERTRFATARENSRYAINGVLMHRTGKKLEFVATDGRRLALARGTCTTESKNEESQCIIPSKALNLLLKLRHDPDQSVSIHYSDSQIIFIIGDEAGQPSMLASNLVEGSFPPYQDVIPKDLDKKVTFELDSLDSAVRRAALLTNEESKGVRLSFNAGNLTITSRAPEMGEAEVHVALSGYEGDDLDIGFNPTFITEALRVIHEPQVLLELKSPNKPGMIKSGNDFLYVIMPVTLS